MNLFDFERRWLAQILRAILPEGAHPTLTLALTDDAITSFIDHFFSTAPLETRLGVRGALWVATLSPLFVLMRFRLLPSLGISARANVLTHLSESDVYVVREMPMLLKMVACFAVAGLPDVRTGMGFVYDDKRSPAWLTESKS